MLVKSNVYNGLYRRPHFRPRKEDIERFHNDIFQARQSEVIEDRCEDKEAEVCDAAQIKHFIAKTIMEPKPKNQKVVDDVPQANLRETKISMEGFDLDTFNFLAKKYSGQEVEVRIKVVPKSHICALSE